jgi:hypothetical protein
MMTRHTHTKRGPQIKLRDVPPAAPAPHKGKKVVYILFYLFLPLSFSFFFINIYYFT